jgi:hypothetical protein
VQFREIPSGGSDFCYSRSMAAVVSPLQQLILGLLAEREHRLLVLVVSVRKALGPYDHIKGDLSELVSSSLKTMVAAGTVNERDGVFSLRRRKS